MTLIEHGLPLIFAVCLWFGSTALVLRADSLPPSTFGRSLAGAGLLAIAGVTAIAATVDDDGIASAYLAFGAALAIWGWHELSFLTGVITGPRRTACPPGAQGWERFRLATATVIHHEVALAATALVLIVAAWGRANPTGAITFALLFVLRVSAKLNIFAGVPNFSDEMMPAHLAYLRGYFGARALHPLLPLTLAGSLLIAAWFARAALTASGGEAVSASLLFALAALGALEHVLLLLPVCDGALWRWASARRATN